jgi:primosomal protein N' (replication factor Y)
VIPDELDLFANAPRPPEAAPPADGAGLAVARVVLDVPLRRAFDYLIPEPLREKVKVGSRVQVPFHGRRAIAFVTELPKTSEVPLARLKPLASLLEETPVVTPEVLALALWVSSYYACGPGEALAAAIPQDVTQKPVRARRPGLDLDALARLAPEAPDAKKTHLGGKQRALVLALANAGGALRVGDLMKLAEADRGSLERLVAKGRLTLESRDPDAGEEPLADAPEPPPPVLTKEQEAALGPITRDLEARRFQTTLLFGVTGSGKTEIYLRAIARTLELGRTAIVLVPEIALTPQTERRFKARFGDRVAVLHSRQEGRLRGDEWWRVRSGAARVVVGPRSALWAPVPDLGLIVVDEEHDGSYKQDSSPRYHARDTAIVRARAADAPVILGSATPSLESWQNAKEGKFRLAQLTQRPGGANLPLCTVVDMRKEYEETRGQPLFSRALELLLKEAFAKDERAILFLNRRGFTTHLHCGRCGHVAKCPQCDITLAYHKRDAVLLCHFCQHRAPPPRGVCPACQGPPLKQRGAGTERIEEVFSALFPGVKTARLDSDVLSAALTPEDVLRRFRQGDARVLVGTQMVAKGLDVHDVTVVGVVSADVGLSLLDFRAAERTFQLVAQVAGRAGRAKRPGRTVIQTFNPDHPAIALAAQHDFSSFAAQELQARKLFGYPPYARLLKVLWRGPDARRVSDEADAAARDLRAALAAENVRVLGPAPSPRAYLAGKHRFQALVKATTTAGVKKAVAALEARGGDKAVELILDVDPVFLL